ncbi:MAG TPA: CocE/NonD family hydrolase [Nocardioidaceae bacterium]|nr:CocE/NonD family hydrolase [Nocardioidaceae bacterium]
MTRPARSPRTRLLALTAAVAVAAPLTAVAGPAAGAPPAPQTPYTLENGVTSPTFEYADAIRETVWVQAPDLDGNGEPDRVAADIIRPRELDASADIPVIMDASPYYLCCGRGNESELKEYDSDGDPAKFPLFYDNYFVPRGYAYVAVDMAGTARSTGCTDEGADSDIRSVRAVVDWLNGRATAVDAAGEPVEADWSNGKTGMIGKSYDGTLANGVAATGVEGLETIVPIAAISSWYDYTRYQGLPFSYNYPTFLSSYIARDRTEAVDCSERLAYMTTHDGDETGAYTDFWADRDYRVGATRNAANVEASVFVVHGLQDFNVKTPNFSRWWDALGAHGVERKMWLTRVGHVDPFDSDRESWVPTLHRWFDHELMGIDNGIDREPAVRAEIAPGEWVESRDWPVAHRFARLQPQDGGGLVLGRRDRDRAGFVNDPSQREAEALTAGANPNRLLFRTGTLEHEVRISGTARVQLDVTHGAPTGQVGVALVDYGESERVLARNGGVRTLQTESCWGASTSTDDSCYLEVEQRRETTPLQVLSRGWARLDGAGRHTVTVALTANDVVVPAGHQIGLVVVGASREWVVTVDRAPTEYSVNLRNTTLRLPIQGRMSDFAPGKSLVPSRDELPAGTLADPREFRIPR